MSALVHRLLLVASVIAAYIWFNIPELQNYSFQAFFLMIGLYFVIKRLSKSHLLHLGPNALSLEMPLITFAVLILIGHTGNTRSAFFAISYLHLFFLVFSSGFATSLLVVMLVTLFHYLMTPTLTVPDYTDLLSLPVMMLVFWFARQQYLQAKSEQKALEVEEATVEAFAIDQTNLLQFLHGFLSPKLQQVQHLIEFPSHNQHLLKNQLTLIQIEIEKVLKAHRWQPSTSSSAVKPNEPTPLKTNLPIAETDTPDTHA